MNPDLSEWDERPGKAEPAGHAHFDVTPRYALGEADAILNRLQRNGGALTACECGSRTWLPPDGIYRMVAANPAQRATEKTVIPVTCAACGYTKFYDPAVVASLAESTGRW